MINSNKWKITSSELYMEYSISILSHLSYVKFYTKYYLITACYLLMT